MKRKWAWLALPLVLVALMFGAKWRAEHPTPTKEDLEIRAALSESRSISFWHSGPPENGEFDSIGDNLTQTESKYLIECLYLLPNSRKDETNGLLNGFNGVVALEWRFAKKRTNKICGAYMFFSVAEKESLCVVRGSGHPQPYRLHPVTMKRWMELLLNHPRIGPQLRTRLK